MAQASRDQNSVPTLLGVSSVDGVTPVTIYVNPTTHRVLTDTAAGSGTVTSVSVVSANGFAGSVADPTTTPAITLTTTVTGILSGNGTAISAASTTGSGAVVLANTPTLITPVLGVATGTSLALGGATIGSNALAVTGTSLFGGNIALGTNSITMTGSIATTLSRVTIGYFTDLDVTNAIAGSVTGNAATATALQNARTIGGVSFNGTANITVATATGGFTVSGGNLALGTNSLTMTGSIAATGARVTKGWFTDIESTNMPTVGGTAILSSLTAPSFTTVELGAGGATDTTLSRVSAGVIAVEGVTVPTISSTSTLTNKTMGDTLILAENASIGLDPAGSADGKYTGITITATAGYTQAFGDLVYLDPTDSRWEQTDANSAAGADGDARGILGMVVVAGTDGNACTILLNGVIRADAKFPSFTINNPIYVSETAGLVTQTQPTTTDVVIRVVGAALTADEMYFAPSYDYITHT